MECQRWFGTIASQTSAMSVPLDFIIEVWYFAEEHGEFFCYSVLTFPGNIFHFEQNLINSLSFFLALDMFAGVTFVQDICQKFLAQNFVGTITALCAYSLRNIFPGDVWFLSDMLMYYATCFLYHCRSVDHAGTCYLRKVI